MKPTHVAVDYFAKHIVKRVSRAFAKREMSKEDFDEIVRNVDNVVSIANKNKAGKEGMNNGKGKDNKES